MKYKIIIAAIVATIAAIIISGNSSSNKAHANLNGPPAGVTGSPGDNGNTCGISGCHTGHAVTAQAGMITSNIPVGGYTPGSTYTITATITYAGKKRFGFQVSPQDLSGTKIGTLANLSGATQILVQKYIEQTSSGHGGNGGRTWTFNWTAPASGTGSFNFYGAFNATDSSGNESGDYIFTSTLAVNEMATPGLDCGVRSIVYPAAAACDSVITPMVKIQNYGTTTLTNCMINYFVDANSPTNYTWNGNLATGQSTIVTLPSLTVTTLGTHTFTATTASPNLSTDLVTNNDQQTSTFNLVFSGSALPFTEGFESTAFPPSGWVRNNPDASTTWARNTAAHFTGSASAKMDNYNYSSVGEQDDLVTPAIDLTSSTNPTLTFEVAYRMYTNPASSNPGSDTLTVYISTDCQQTWTEIYKKYSTPLSTVVPAYSTAAFTPTSTQWRQESISLLPYQTAATAYLKFSNTTDYENNLYLDDINISGPAGIADPASEISTLELFPNPAVNLLNVNYSLKENATVSIRVFNVQGKVVSNNSLGEKPEGKYSEIISTENLEPGIYMLQITAGPAVITRKFIVTR